MKQLCWAGKTLKQLSVSTKYTKAGRNSSGAITMFHRGGGSTRLLRRIDFKRNILMTGFVERIEYDPNRSARIALIRWSSADKARAQQATQWEPLLCGHTRRGPVVSNLEVGLEPVDMEEQSLSQADQKRVDNKDPNFSALFSYILACDQLKVGDNVMNLHLNSNLQQTSSTALKTVHNTDVNSWEQDKLYQQVGNCIPLSKIPIGTFLHNIEMHPGQGGKVVRSAGTFAQLVQKLPLEAPRICMVRLPSGLSRAFDSRCRATIGIVSNPAHNTRKLRKAGQRRWLGKRPIVRGVAMNPIDHPHGGGEGRTKGGRPSVSPWGKPTKGGFRTVMRKHKK